MQVDYKSQKGWHIIGNRKYFFRSKLEYRWAQYLELLKRAGEVLYWDYEAVKFEFEKIRSGTVFYTPDFRVKYADETVIWQELKGHLTSKDVTKFKRMAKYYPEETLILVMQRIPKKFNHNLETAKKYVERIIDAEKELRKVGL